MEVDSIFTNVSEKLIWKKITPRELQKGKW